MSFLTCFWLFPQNEHFSRSPPSPNLATVSLPLDGLSSAHAGRGPDGRELAVREELVDDAVGQSLVGAHDEVPIGVGADLLDRLAGVVRQDLVQQLAHPGDLFGLDLDVDGLSGGAAAVLLASGAPKKRYALPHARILIHQPHGGASGQAVDIEIQAKEITRMRELLDQILAYHTGQTVEKVGGDTDRDFIMSSDEAQTYGIVDEILTNRELASVGT